MSQNDEHGQSLTPGAQRLVETALRKQKESQQAKLGVYHWLLALLERHGPMAEELVRGLAASMLRQSLYTQLQQGNAGDPLEPESVVSQAVERAKGRGKQQASERDLAAVILSSAGY